MRKKKVLIFVVAYNAEKTISSVLDRIPDQVFNDKRYKVEVLIIDDCSSDRTFEEGNTYKRNNSRIPLTVLANPVNLGYGGNQKLGYRYAIDKGFDVVALLHGDGQYAPEKLQDLLEPLIEEDAEAVFGSRMLNKGAALEGGMPYYKYVGNQILTFIQNKLVGTNLSEYHSGYRLYQVDTLNELPFENNSNNFDFDTDIIIQLHLNEARILELPIPTFYGNEICHVNGLQYAKEIIKTCIKSRLQRYGIFYDPKFDFQSRNTQYQSKYSFYSSHSLALDAVKPGDRVLSLGCGSAELIKPFFEKGCELTTVDMYTDAELQQLSEECFETDLEDFSLEEISSTEKFDSVLALDIIEHLRDPEEMLQMLRRDKRFQGSTLVITTPNIAFFAIRLMLLIGFFNYGKRGILDRTHTRLFTFGSLRYILSQQGYRIKCIKGIPAPFPLALGDSSLGALLLNLNRIAIALIKSLFSYQIYCEAEISPTTEVLLQRAKGHSAKRRRKLNKPPSATVH